LSPSAGTAVFFVFVVFAPKHSPEDTPIKMTNHTKKTVLCLSRAFPSRRQEEWVEVDFFRILGRAWASKYREHELRAERELGNRT
jgi:hypothetical protein